jgi:hypothetical protein
MRTELPLIHEIRECAPQMTIKELSQKFGLSDVETRNLLFRNRIGFKKTDRRLPKTMDGIYIPKPIRDPIYQPDPPKEKMIRVKGVYSNSSPMGIASQDREL